MKQQLQNILNQLENPEHNQQKLGYKALAIINDILTENPFDIETRMIKMRLNASVFENSTEIIQDATFITENEQFKEHKIIGYDWLFWVYNSVLAMPKKAEETLNEQLIDIQTLYDKKYIKIDKESELLNQLAQIKYDNNQENEALKIWKKSFDKNTFLDNRNSFVGYLCLEKNDFVHAEKFLLKNWYLVLMGHEIPEFVKVGHKLQEQLLNNELTEYPNLIGLYYNILRNETAAFGLDNTLDFYEKHLPALEKWGNKFPDCSFIWVAIGNTYMLDAKNFEKAFEAYKIMLKGDEPYTFSVIKRVYKSAKKSKNNFLDIDFPMKGNALEMYELLTNFKEFAEKTKKTKKKKQFIKWAVEFGENGYKQFYELLINGEGNVENNNPHRFAMHCNNYANTLGSYADLHLKKEEKAKVYDLAGKIHMEGYEISPFVENLENASIDYYRGENYKNAIKYSLQYITDYKSNLSVYDYQYHYWQIVRSYIELKDISGAEKYFLEAKKLFDKVGKGSKKANYKFIFTSKLFLEFAVVKRKEYQKYIPEMEWFLEQEVAMKQEPKEHGLISYYLGVCYKETNQREKALKVFQVTVDYLQDVDWEFYETKCEMAEDYIEELGGKVVKREVSKTMLSGFWKKITNLANRLTSSKTKKN